MRVQVNQNGLLKERYKYDSIFESLGPQDGKITGAGKADEFLQVIFILLGIKCSN